MSLKVTVFSASKLLDVDIVGQSDPFVVLNFRGREEKTEVQSNNLNPVWKDATFEWYLGDSAISYGDKLSVKVKDHDIGWVKTLLGQVDVSDGELRQNRKFTIREYRLLDRNDFPIEGKIKLGLEYIPPGGVASDKAGEHEADSEEQDEESDDNDGDEKDDDKGKKRKFSSKVKKKRKRRHLTRQWSDKIKNFQIRIRILEGRDLPGTRINPVVRTTVAGQRQETTIKHSTDRPVYNELLSFSFRSSEAELFDKLICFKVFNSRGLLRSEALLGYFECDIGSVYERKGHAFVRKWIMLNKPIGKSDQDDGNHFMKSPRRSPAGYLKVTAVVLAPGDKAPAGIDMPRKDDKDDDIDSNCLMPLDVPRQSAMFVLTVYHANDLPRMDTGVTMIFRRFFKFFSSSKETEKEDRSTADSLGLVDPFLTFSFCGKQASTNIVYNDSNPTFNQYLKIPFMFPTMCERLKLQLIDWDEGSSNDFIGTAFLSLSSISGPGSLGEGFLPKFGPCFINFYGSPREYHQMPDKYDFLNKGIGEGVAYRGRVLVELKTLPTESIAYPVQQSWVKQNDIGVELYKKQSDFALFACFHEANMVTVHDGPVEFEVSIGNNGTKFDETVAPSNTSPCNALYDGMHYHYLPWGREKPCVWIECTWEDIAFRIEPLNILNTMKANLKRDLEEVQRKTRTMSSVLEGFVDTCRKELKRFEDYVPKIMGKRNDLDKDIYNLRLKELDNLACEAFVLMKEKNSAKVAEEMKSYLNRIKSMAIEPQLSMPDVVLWMISGNKRVAYYRVPAHDLLFSETEAARGKFCGKTIDLKLKYPGRGAKKNHPEILAMVRLELWLGLVEHRHHWINRERTEGEFNVYAETYENERKVTKRGKSEWVPLTRQDWPHFSDYAGNLELLKKAFKEPDGWKFSGEWKEAQGDLMMFQQPDKHLTKFVDQVYEHETRKIPGGKWEPAESRFTNEYGNTLPTLPTDPPRGWKWTTAGHGWIVDVNRAVDQEGWEYSPHSSFSDYTPKQKAYHLCRRRRQTRSRERLPMGFGKDAHEESSTTEGWQYARTFHENFHPKETRTDSLRRKRFMKKIVPKSEKFDKQCPVFNFLVEGQKKKQSNLSVLPRMFVTFQDSHKYQLWVSVYQARGLVARDKSGSNDPYVVVTFSNQSQETATLYQTISPTWNETLIFQEVEIFENPRNVKENPPSVVMEIFDEDKGKIHEFLGRCIFKPKVKLDENDVLEPELAWYKIRRGDEDGGEILAECELFLNEGAELPTPPPLRNNVYPVRPEVQPETHNKAIEILCWGVRNMKESLSLRGLKPSVEFECNQTIIGSSDVIKDMKKCPNFLNPVLQRKTMTLPKKDIYAPPINIRVFDHGTMGKPKVIGLHVIQSLRDFEVQPASNGGQPKEQRKKKKWPTTDATDGKGKASQGKPFKPVVTDEFDWWSKYDASRAALADAGSESHKDRNKREDSKRHIDKYLAKGYDTLEIYSCKLEDVSQFRGFNDFIATFPLRKGKTKSSRDYDTEVGQLKGSFRIYPDADESVHQSTMETMPRPSRDPIECLVRVYVVRAWHLQPKDSDGLADPYLIVSLGDKTYDETKNHVPKSLDPIFGRIFVFKAKIPLVKDLKITVMDYDFPDPDDVIGETVIDLEQRLLSKHHATCGLPKTYFISGPCQWREALTPFQLLAKHCILTGKGLKLDTGNPSYIYVNQTPYTLNQFEEGTPPDADLVGEPTERLALHVLHTCNLVPEHVETRPLYNKVQPDIEQGKLEMWVDIFSKEDECFQMKPLMSSSYTSLGKVFSKEDECFQMKPLMSSSYTSLDGDPSSSGVDRVDSLHVHTIVGPSEGRVEIPSDVRGKISIQAPICIDPRQPLEFELRAIIWSTTDVLLNDTNVFGEEMSDIFVKAWLEGMDNKKQETSTHERSFDGNGSFNWRMKFPFHYLPIEKEIVVKDKAHIFSFDVREERVPPIFKFQIYDKDRLTWSDFLGQQQLNLAELIRPCPHPSHCGTNRDPAKKRIKQTVDLFALKEIRGWWACYNEDIQSDPTGKVEMTLKIVDAEEAEAQPCGLGQSEPNQNPVLPKPIRPSTSFLWYLAPFKTCRYIVWKHSKGFIIKLVIIILLILLIASFVYNVPGYAAKKVLDV